MAIAYIKNDLFKELNPNDAIMHVVNNINAWGAGFVISLAKHLPLTKQKYHLWFQGEDDINAPPALGEIQVIPGMIWQDGTVCCVNMCAQNNIVSQHNPRPLNYEALYICLQKVRDREILRDKQLVAPKFGAGLAGGSWNIIEAMINDVFKDRKVLIFSL